MASVNKAILIGNLGRDPEVKSLPSGISVANLAIATSESYKDKEGNKVEKTEWHRVTLFDKLADIAGQYLVKGSQVYIEGRIQTRKYEKDGVDHYATEIVGRELRMLGGKPSAASDDAAAAPAAAAPAPAARRAPNPAAAPVAAGDGFEDDDIPF